MTDTTRVLLAILLSVTIVSAVALTGRIVHRRVFDVSFEEVQVIRMAHARMGQPSMP